MEELLKRQYPLQTSSRPYTLQLNSEGEGCICREPGLGAEGWWKGWLGPSGSYVLLLASLVQQPCAVLSKLSAHNIMVPCFFENSEKLLAQKQCSFLDIVIRESSALEKIYLLLFFLSLQPPMTEGSEYHDLALQQASPAPCFWSDTAPVSPKSRRHQMKQRSRGRGSSKVQASELGFIFSVS